MHILINGAGIAGSALAWHLSKLKHQVTVLEKSKEFLGQGQNVDLSVGAIKILRNMGLIEEVRKYNTTEQGTVFLGQDCKPIGTFPVNPEGPSPTAEFEILRGDLALILYNATKDQPNVEYKFGVLIDELVSNTATSVKVKLNDGSIHEYDMAVAADGQGSKLRKLAFPADQITNVDRKAWCIYWTVPKQADDTEWWYIFPGLEARMISLRPDPHGTMRACVTKIPSNPEEKQDWETRSRGDRKTQAALMEKYFGNAGWQTRRFLDAIPDAPDFYMHPLIQIKMKKWSTGSVVCIGDAAHAATPITGMGTTLAVVGAYVLAGELSALEKGDSPQKAFEAYDKKFHAYTDKVQDLPSFVPGIVHPSSKWHLWALETVVSIVSWILKISFISKAMGSRGQESENDAFPLPQYAKLNEHYPVAESI